VDVAGVKTAIWEALNNPSISIVCLVGRWGVGKTHLWKSIIEERGRDLQSMYPRYAYVSLFGLRAISDLKSSLLLESSETESLGHDSSICDSKWWAAAKRKKSALIKRLQKSANQLGMIGKATAEAIQLGLDAFDFRAVRNCLICLDDLERMAPELEAIEVMGLIETLARERECKVFLIFSPDDLGDASKNSLNLFREKIFDKEIHFDPPTTYGINIISQGHDSNTVNALRKVADALGLKNVRVLRKVIVGFEDVLSHLPELSLPVKQSLMNSLGVLYYCHLVRGDGVPTVDEVLAIEFVPPIQKSNGDQYNTKHIEFLQKAGWVYPSAADRFLASYIEKGVCDWQGLSAEMKIENEEIKISSCREQIQKIWDEYRRSFHDTQGWRAFSERLYNAFLENIDLVPTGHLDSALWVLRKAGMEDQADSLIDKWREVHIERKDMFDLAALERLHTISDPGLRKVCELEYQPDEGKSKTISEALAQISIEKTWGADDTAYLESARVEDYINALRNKEFAQSILDGMLNFLRLSNPSQAELTIRGKIESALRKIASDSDINREKVRALGVSLDEQQQRQS
jgi:hypothetical protein